MVRLHNLPLASMNRQTREKVISSIGRVVQVDVREDNVGWGSCLQVRIECDLKKRIATERTMCLGGVSMWVALTYEKLPRLCFKCGRIVYLKQGCAESGEGQFGPWLRATKIIRGGSGRGMTGDDVKGSIDGVGSENWGGVEHPKNNGSK